MQEPRELDWEKLNRLGRYLVGRERMCVDFEYQKLKKGLTFGQIRITRDVEKHESRLQVVSLELDPTP